MRIVTWNMGRSRAKHRAAWHYLQSHLQPDVACVQEAIAPSDGDVGDCGTFFWRDPKRPGGTGIFVRRGIRAVVISSPVPGSYVAGVSVRLLGQDTSVFSIHVGPETWKNQKTLRPWLLGQQAAIVGGDFNTSRSYSRRHKEYLDGLIAEGLHDCCCPSGIEAQSFWGHQASQAKTYQDDHFFASPSLSLVVRACGVVDNPLTRMLSDHGPLVLELGPKTG
jgi:exonuclease III